MKINRNKKILTILLALITMLGLVSCNKKSKDGDYPKPGEDMPAYAIETGADINTL